MEVYCCSFPDTKNPRMLSKWVTILKSVKKNATWCPHNKAQICSRHFDVTDYNHIGKNPKLKSTAFPKRNLNSSKLQTGSSKQEINLSSQSIDYKTWLASIGLSFIIASSKSNLTATVPIQFCLGIEDQDVDVVSERSKKDYKVIITFHI